VRRSIGRRVVYDFIATELGAREIEDVVRIQVALAAAFESRRERRQLRSDQSDRRRHDDIYRAARLEPDAVEKAIGQASVIDNGRAAGSVSEYRAPVGVDVVVTEMPVVVFVVRLELRLRLVDALGKRTGRGQGNAENTE